MALKQKLIVVAIVVIVKGWCCHACFEDERIALLQLKAFFINSSLPAAGRLDYWGKRALYSWGKSANCCIWDRIECDSVSGHVTQLDLAFLNPRGWDHSIPMLLNTSLFLPFKQLNSLYLYDNNIIDCIENEGFERLAELRNLEVLALGFNNFKTDILSSLSALLSLKVLDLSGTGMKGTINLGELSNLKKLESLYLYANEIEDFIFSNGSEAELGLSNLQGLYLGENRFNNSILLSLKRFSSLKYLDIRYNQLKGSLNVKDLSDLRNLEMLDLSGNEISKFVTSKDINHSSNLSTMYLIDMTNNGTSVLLQSLGAFPHLRTLHLEYSYLRGARFGSELHNFTNLEELFLNGSFVDENFLKSIEALSSLKLLSLLGVESILPTQGLSNLRNVERLELSYIFIPDSNKFFQTIERMTSLKVLSFSGCGLTGILAAAGGLCNLKHLQELDMSSNDLSGTLPTCLANLTSLEQLDLSSNHFMGNISLSPLSSLTAIQDLRLSYNNFQIPISLGPFFNCSKLKSMAAVDNELYATVEVKDLTPRFQLERITLSSCGCGGSFPGFLYHQHELQYVDLSSIKLSGEFPYWLLHNNTKLEALYLANNSLAGVFQLPMHLLSRLTTLDISNNNISGQIPTEIGAYFPWLEYLNMSNNGFNGTIPSSFGDLSSLVYLDMSNNGFNGTIPSSFGDLRSLESLDMSNNGFNDTIPSCLGNLRLMGMLDLSNNQLSGSVPEHLFKGCFHLWTLILSNNNLQGQILPQNAGSEILEYLQLGGNQFNGTIPQSLANFSSLIVLDVNNNTLSGEIPSWLGGMYSLQILDLSNNNISGRLPFGFPPSLREVYLSKNLLQGSLADAFKNCSEVMTIDLSHNSLTGSMPTWIGKLSQLSFLLLSHNKLEGEIPSHLCMLDQLSLIDLSNNYISGVIPPCLICSSKWYRAHEPTSNPSTIAQAPNISIAPSTPNAAEPPVEQPQQPLEFTTKSISYSYKGRILALLAGIDLSCNNLTGKIPPDIGNLDKIQVLNLSHNSLSGSIPPTFSNLQQIESLDLSHNNLEGKIPPQLTQLTSISAFSVAYNNLSGKTPDRVKQFATFDKNSYEGNPFLCGDPLPKSCTSAVPPSLMPRPSTGDDENNGIIDMEVFYVSFVVSYFMVLLAIAAVLYINPHWRRAWFYFIEVKMTDCYYFLVDNCPMLFKFKVW